MLFSEFTEDSEFSYRRIIYFKTFETSFFQNFRLSLNSRFLDNKYSALIFLLDSFPETMLRVFKMLDDSRKRRIQMLVHSLSEDNACQTFMPPSPFQNAAQNYRVILQFRVQIPYFLSADHHVTNYLDKQRRKFAFDVKNLSEDEAMIDLHS